MNLTASDAWGAASEVRAGALTMRPLRPEAITQIMPLAGRDVSPALQAAVGLGFPEPGRSHARHGARIVWSEREEALLLGPGVDVDGAVCVDQSDGWAALILTGSVRDTLARLCPLDLRERVFGVGATARTLLKHVAISLTRVDETDWLLLAPRALAGSVLAELVEAAEGVAARR